MNRTVVRNAIAALVVIVLGAIAAVVVSDFLSSDASLDAQLGRLHSAFAFRRRSAAAELARFAPEAARIVPELLKACGDPDPEVRTNALTSLQEMGKLPPESLPVLVPILKDDPDIGCRRGAAACLGKLSDPGAEAALVAAIDDPDPTVRLAAIGAIGIGGQAGLSKPAIDRLSRLVREDVSEEIHQACLQDLGIDVGKREDVARTVAEVVAKNPSAAIRNGATILIAKSKFDFQVPVLLAALEDKSPQVRLTAAGALVPIGFNDPKILPALCKALRNGDDVTRAGLATHINRFRWDLPDAPKERIERQCLETVKDLGALLDLKEPDVRADILNLLVKVVARYQASRDPVLFEAAKAALAIIVGRIDDEKENASFRLFALNQWVMVQVRNTPLAPGARLKDDKGNDTDQLHARGVWLGALARTLTSSNPDLAARASELMLDALQDRDAPQWYRDAWRQAVPDVIKAVRSDNPKVRSLSLAILAGLGPEAQGGLDELKEAAKGLQDPHDQGEAARAIKSLSAGAGLKAADPAVRAEAAALLGDLGWHASRVLPDLTGLLKDPDPKVRAAAASSLARLGAVGKEAVTPLAEAFSHEADPAGRVTLLNAGVTIGADSPGVVEMILAGLHDQSLEVRRASAALKSFPATDPVTKALIQALEDPDKDVRRGAAKGLTTLLYRNAAVIPALLKAMKEPEKEKKDVVMQAVDDHFDQVTATADLGGPGRNNAGSKSVVLAAVPAILDGLAQKDVEVSRRAFYILGRLFGLGRGADPEVQQALGEALPRFLAGLDSGDGYIRETVIGELGGLAVDRPAVVSAIVKELERPGIDSDERTELFQALARQSRSARTDAALHATLVPAIPALTKALDDPKQEVCESAIPVLRALGKDASGLVAKLRTMAYQHAQPSTRRMAEDAAREIEGLVEGKASTGKASEPRKSAPMQ